MELPYSTRYLIIAIITASTWGLTGIFVQLLPAYSPVTLTAVRLIIALLVSLPLLTLSQTTRHNIKSTLKQPIAYLLALLLAGYYLLATAAFQMAPVAEVALLLSTPPLFVLLLRQLRSVPPQKTEIVGAIIAAIGIVIILAPKLSLAATSSQHLYGNAIALFAATLTALYAYLYHNLSQRNDAPETGTVTILTFIIGSVLLTPLLLFSSSQSTFTDMNIKIVSLLLGLGIISTAIPSLGFALISKHLPAIITSTVALFIPTFAALLAFFILDEYISFNFLLGCAFVLTGVGLIINSTPK